MKNCTILFVIFISQIFFAQDILLSYPDGQEPYNGGYVEFYKDFNQILNDKNLKACEDKNEIYTFPVLIKRDNKISFVADDEENGEKYNKCSKNLSREVAKHLQGWKAATVDGENVSAVAKFVIIPDQLFGVLKPGYDLENNKDEILPEFPGGIKAFRNLAAIRVDNNRYSFGTDTTIEITFVVERDGSIEEVKLAQSSGLKEFDVMMISAVSGIKKKWKPATISGIPVRYRFRIPFKFQGSTY